VGRGSRPHRHRSWYSTFAPFPHTCPRNQPGLGQAYATVVLGQGRVSGEQMLTVGRGLRMTATAQLRAFQPCRQQQRAETTRQAPSTLLCGHAGRSTTLLELCRIIPADSLPRLGLLQPAGGSCSKKTCVNIYSSHVLSGRYQ